MDTQFYGANCVSLSSKDARLVIDDNLVELGLKSIIKSGDIVLFTGPHADVSATARLVVDQPGEYEVSGLSIVGIAAQAHVDEAGTHNATMYKLIAGDTSYLFTGHIYPDLNDEQLEAIGMVDVMFVPVGDSGFTLDAIGALKLIKKIEPKLVIPTHYADEAIHYAVGQQDLDQVLKNLGMEPKETISRLRYKPSETDSVTQLVILARS